MNENIEDRNNLLPLIIGAGAIALLLRTLFEEIEYYGHTIKKRIFISFSIEDERYRDFLVDQAENERSPFSFVDMSVKQPWNNKIWKQKCRKKIRSCDGMIVLLSRHTWHSSGTRWEIKCAREERIPVIGMHIKKEERGAIPPELKGKRIITWTWDNLAESIGDI